MRPFPSRWLVAGASWAAAGMLLSSPLGAQELRTFTIQKPPELIEQERRTTPVEREPARLPAARDRLRMSLGMGYVQGADWGTELGAVGAFKGVQVQSAALVTRGANGLLVDN